MFKQLFWKEWRENVWKLTFCGAVSVAFTALLFRIRLFPDAGSCFAISIVQMFVVPVVYALDIFSGEMSNRTIHLLFKFPVSRWKIFFSKYLVCMLGMSMIFLATGGLMEVLTQGRETPVGFLIKSNLLFAIPALLLFTWFCVFAAQSRSEAGSLAAILAVMIGWGIVLFWAFFCEVEWAMCFVPYVTTLAWPPGETEVLFRSPRPVLSLLASLFVSLGIACYRFVKVRRYL